MNFWLTSVNVGSLLYLLNKLVAAWQLNTWAWLAIIAELKISQAISQNADLKTASVGFYTFRSYFT